MAGVKTLSYTRSDSCADHVGEPWTANWLCAAATSATVAAEGPDGAAHSFARSKSSSSRPSPLASMSPMQSSDKAQGFGKELPVFLNIYDVSNQEGVKVMNSVLAHWLSPVKFGGAFHTGVEVGGIEWSYGRTYRDTRPGIIGMPPRSDPKHSFRQTIPLGFTRMSLEQVNHTISELIEDYPGQEYEVFRHNCCHFADDFSHRLGTEAIPGWVHRLARLGAGADELIQMVFGNDACALPSVVPESMASASHGSGAIESGRPALPERASGSLRVPLELCSAAPVKDSGEMPPL